jgi:acetyl esterase/lipase
MDSKARREPTVSDYAAQLARATRAFRVPIPLPSSMVKPLLRSIRQRVRAWEAPRIAELKDRLIEDVVHHDYGGVPVIEIVPRSIAGRARHNGDFAVYLHGGAYILGTADDSLGLMMADELRVPVFSIDYDLAPDAVFPTALDQVVEAYRELVKARSGRMVLFGVSSGAGLALALANRLNRLGLPMPRALGLFTPWADLTGAGDSYRANEGRDRSIVWKYQLDRAAGAYAASTSRRDVGLSPIYDGYTSTYPPSMITTGTRDLFLSDCVRLYWKLRDAGAVAELRVWEGMWHGLPSEPEMPESRSCRAEMGDFLRRALGTDAEDDLIVGTERLSPGA